MRFEPAQVRHALRVGVAAVLTLVIAEFFNMEQGYWAVISAIIVMHATVGRSLGAGASRILGTAIGAALSAVAVLLLGDTPLSLGLAIFLTLLVCGYLTYLHEAFRMAGITAGIVILVSSGDAGIVHTAFVRFVEISMGVSVAMAVSMFFLPSRATAGLITGIASNLETLALLYETLVSGCLDNTYDEERVAELKGRVHTAQNGNAKLLGEARKEPTGLSKRRMVVAGIVDWELRLFEDMLSLDHAARELANEALHQRMHKSLDSLGKATEQALCAMAASLRNERPRPLAGGPEADALRAALHEVEHGLQELRRRKESASYALTEVSHFFSLVFAMREAASECFRGFELLAQLESAKSRTHAITAEKA
ncbi:MAG: FUSC family protein [Oceanidesulfovibrio sp.]